MRTNIWNMDLSQRSWWWWFWIIFMENPENPNYPKQLAVIWSTKDCDRIKINDLLWVREKSILKKDNRIEFSGAIGTWFFDGSMMREPLFLDKHDFVVEDNYGFGRLATMHDDRHVFSGGSDGFDLHLEKDGFNIDLDLTSTDDRLSEPSFTHNSYFRGYGFDILKIRRMNVKGLLDDGGQKTDVAGSAYFQKVRINAPIIPCWYWGTVHMHDGSYLQYYLPHFGLPSLRRKYSHRSVLDRGEMNFSKKISFYSKGRDRFYDFKDVKLSKHYNENELPVFHLTGRKDGRKISFTLNTYSRACWYHEQPMLRLIRTFLYYNEYPAVLSRFLLESDGKRITEADVGGGVGNCEHSWGCIL